MEHSCELLWGKLLNGLIAVINFIAAGQWKLHLKEEKKIVPKDPGHFKKPLTISLELIATLKVKNWNFSVLNDVRCSLKAMELDFHILNVI